MRNDKKDQAIALRRQGISIPKIATQLQSSIGSVGNWVRHIVLTDQQKQILKESRPNLAHREIAIQKWRQHKADIRLVAFEQGKARCVLDRDFALICALYWGEGYKADNKNTFNIANADATMIRFIISWLMKNNYSDVIHIHIVSHKENHITNEELLTYWLQQLPQTTKKHYNPIQRPDTHRTSQRKRIDKVPYGTLTVSVYRTELIQQVLGGIDYLKNTPP